MFFISKLLGVKIYDLKGTYSGNLKDLCVLLYEGYPQVTDVLVKRNGGEFRVPWGDIRSFEESQIFLSIPDSEFVSGEPKEDEVFLARDILNKQIVDTEGRKLIRVQDIQLARLKENLAVMAVDVSIGAIIRNLGFDKLIPGALREKLEPKLIDWKNLSFLGIEQHDIRLRVINKKLEVLHPADIADIVSELSPDQRTKILQAMDQDVAADTIEEMHENYQASTLAGLESKKASQILEEMAPDEAADLVADLPPGKANELLGLMKVDEAYEIKQLLKFPENSAGGIMTTEVVMIPEDFTAEDAVKKVREKGHEIDTISYIYVVDKEGILKGVFSLKELIMADPKSLVSDFMKQNVISVGLLAEQDEVAKLVAKYDILAVPVVDDKTRIKGIVTIDDALDVIIPTKWKKRFPRIY